MRQSIKVHTTNMMKNGDKTIAKGNSTVPINVKTPPIQMIIAITMRIQINLMNFSTITSYSQAFEPIQSIIANVFGSSNPNADGPSSQILSKMYPSSLNVSKTTSSTPLTNRLAACECRLKMPKSTRLSPMPRIHPHTLPAYVSGTSRAL